MELTQIKYFLEVAETEHMTATAEKLHVAQPSLSQAIRRLEKELGVPLFEKKGRNICLTQYGKHAQEKLRPAMEAMEALPGELTAMAHVDRETVYVNVQAASGLLTKAVIKFKERHPGVNFKLQQGEEAETYDIRIFTRLSEGEADYDPEKNLYHSASLFADRSGQQEEKNTFVYREKICLALPNRQEYAGMASVSLADMAEEDFISLSGSRQFRTLCDEICGKAGIRPRYAFESDSTAAVQEMIAANMGVGFWPARSWGRMESARVRLVPIGTPACSRDLVVCLNRNTNSRYAEEFYRSFLDVLKRM